MKELYLLAKEQHAGWMAGKEEENQEPKLKQLQKRLMPTGEPGGALKDELGSLYLRQIQQCVQVIDRAEADKQGTNQEKHFSEFEKYKLGAKFMSMVESPVKFQHFERFLANSDNR